MKHRQRLPFVFAALFFALAAAGWLAVHIGAVPLNDAILWELRLPRVCLGAMVGVALATAGVLFQGLLRNPLADPFILGTSSGASVGVLAASLLHWHSRFALYVLALTGSLLAIVAVYRIARTQGRTPVQTLILSGVLVSTFLNAIVFLGVSLFYKEAFSAMFFLLGTLTESDPQLLTISASLIAVSVLVAWLLSYRLNLLSLGDASAYHLGLKPERWRAILFVLGSVMVAAAVSVSGMIGFVGLMVPHMLRLVVGPDHRALLPASALGGAILLVVMDTAARTVAAPVEIPVGVLAALCGTPFLVYLLRRKKGDLF